ncbi:hypothetical protein M9Y10_008691 [Tritrichomonas musculus]|uniref:Uncharacterized protein n=1 Tax=Tritrichomonas musculus TaxID=1915356 RepID=A0ABR2IZ25_9EUKA
MYLRNCTFRNVKLKKCQTSILTATNVSEEPKNIIPLIAGYEGYKTNLFAINKTFNEIPVFKGNKQLLYDMTKSKIISDDDHKIDIYPIIIKDHKKLGPITNKTLSMSLHQIMKRKK